MADHIEMLGFEPPHPGEYLREDILPAIDMNITQLAEHLGVSRQSISRLVNERCSVSVEMAQRLGQAFENGARYWLTLQMQHDLWKAENHTNNITVLPLDSNSRAA